VPSTSSFGPFVNHNHFAGYVGMIIPIAVCLAFTVAERRGDRPPVDEFAFDRWGRAGLALYGAVVLVVALFFSLSRGGILSSAVSGLVLFTLVARRLGSRLLVWSTAAVLVLVVIGFIGWIGADVVSHQVGTVGNLGNEASFQSRSEAWFTMIRHIGPYVWVGSGFGTFEDSFAPFTPAGSTRRWDRAHNDYLQLLWETGILGVVIFLTGALVFCRRYWWAALRARGDEESLVRVGLAVSVLAIALHSVVDLNLQIGSNGFLFAVITGVIVGLHRVRADRDHPGPVPREIPAPADGPRIAGDAGSA
jgi:O-antigen ligase